MKQVITIGLDLAKHVFQVHGADAEGSPVFSRKLRRSEVLRFFEKLPPCLVGMEACGSSHYWAREIAAFGHEVRLIPPAYVKPFVKRGKTDAADAEAISEAVTRKTMRFVPIKTVEQQAAAMVLKTRALPFWCGSERRRSTPYARIWPNWASSPPPAWQGLRRWSRSCGTRPMLACRQQRALP
jgi:transposase